ncbi:MAG: hypothetical protein NZM09_02295, partial [Ignavibacterium sp.]|nr:hypothetical protein [Ignavibacterium sp.]MDW8374507.1 hypothetical protein [Ignavibacteriales bacterium]
SYEVSVIEDDEERRLLDEHFINTIGKTYSEIVRIYKFKDEDYNKVLRKRLEKEIELLKRNIDNDDDDDYFNKLINPDKDPEDDK